MRAAANDMHCDTLSITLSHTHTRVNKYTQCIVIHAISSFSFFFAVADAVGVVVTVLCYFGWSMKKFVICLINK